MRKKVNNGKGVSVHGIAGTYVVLLGMDATAQARKGLLGFAIHRTDKTEKEQYWLLGFRTFKDTEPNPTPGTLISTQQHPVQGFVWGDYTAKANHTYVYKVVPVYGTPKNLEYGTPAELTIKTENEDNGTHAIYFNRGVAGSQAYTRKFGDKKPKEVGKEAYDWLSRGALEAILKYIGQAKGKRYSIRAAVYEFSYLPVLEAFKKASTSGADVKIVYDCRQPQPQKTSNVMIKKAGISKLMIKRTANASYISHNKFIVLLDKGKPVQVLTGSTNFTEGGIFGQSNVVHIVRDPKVAARYLEYWEQLAANTDAKELRPWNSENNPDPEELKKGITNVFSPRSSLGALNWYADQVNIANKSINFTAAFGVNKTIAGFLAKNKKNFRYLILEKEGNTYNDFIDNRNNFVALGSVLNPKAVGDVIFQRWLKEELSNLNKNVKYLHTKYLLVDPLSDDPLLVSGSANFSDASTKNNDENMLLIKGNTLVADIYLGEFMRLWHHFFFRDIANRLAHKTTVDTAYLYPNDKWTDNFYGKNVRKTAERQLFA
jgi:phosphatidylserine/phosphatidylglycerophosphate/cardiolipin synthase-like enzyme